MKPHKSLAGERPEGYHVLLSVKARLRGGLSGVGKGWVRLNQSKAGAAVGEEVRGLGGEGVALVITLR